MKSKDSRGHVEVSPLTYNQRGFSRSRFILTLILTVVVSLSLIVGGTLTFFGFRSQHFVTVNGRELLTPDILETLRSQLSQPGLTQEQKIMGLLQALRPKEQSLMWMFYGVNHGIDFKAADLYEALKKEFATQKEEYQKRYKSYFPLTYPNFVKENVDSVNVSATVRALNVPNIPDDQNITQEYIFDHTSSILRYRYADPGAYLLKTQPTNVSTFYDKSSKKIVSGKNLVVIRFDSSQEADAEGKKLAQNPQLAKTRFSAAKETLTLNKDRDSEAYVYVQNIAVGDVTPSFSYRGKNYVGKVLSENIFPFEKLSENEKNQVAQNYSKSLSQDQQDAIRKQLEKDIVTPTPPAYVSSGSTLPVKFGELSDIRDAHTSRPLPFVDASNKDFSSYVFAEVGTRSPVLTYKGIVYSLEIERKTQPTFPIPKQEYDKLRGILRQREDNMWLLYHQAQMRDTVKVEISTENLKQLL